MRYARIEGSREEKLNALENITDFVSIQWQDCPGDWQAPFAPDGEGTYFGWPLLTDLMPWQHSGVQIKRKWPISADELTLKQRWNALLSTKDRATAFREDRDRIVSRSYSLRLTDQFDLTPIAELEENTPPPPICRFAYRSFDRQYVLADGRVISFARPPLWESLSDRQIFLTSTFSQPLGRGPALTAAAIIPDLDHFHGRGSKSIVPLYRTQNEGEPNVLPGLLELLAGNYGRELTPEDFAAYLYGIMAHPAYTKRYYGELDTHQVRVPLTKDGALFEKVCDAGARLLWRHTYGERYVPEGHTPGQTPAGTARCTAGVPTDADGYPQSYRYDASTRTLHVGQGRFAPVSTEVYEFQVSGLKVVQSWLNYRMKDGAGKRSSPLDDIRPTVWPATFTTELLELLWTLEATVEVYPEQAELLDAVVNGDYIVAAELPPVPAGMRQPPKPPKASDQLV